MWSTSHATTRSDQQNETKHRMRTKLCDPKGEKVNHVKCDEQGKKKCERQILSLVRDCVLALAT